MKFIEKGNKIKITTADKRVFDSVILNVDKDRLTVAVPSSEQSCEVCFEEGDEIDCQVISRFGIRLFKSLIMDILGNQFVIEFDPNDYETCQRRKYLRVNTIITAILDINDEIYYVRTIDLGGGGIKFSSDKELPVNVNAKLKIVLDNNEPSVVVYGKILKQGYYRYNEYLLFFDDNFNEHDRSRIIKKCMQIQAEDVRKILDKNDTDK